jgi:hypothetical protein
MVVGHVFFFVHAVLLHVYVVGLWEAGLTHNCTGLSVQRSVFFSLVETVFICLV